jgi:hypothetical protein
MAINSITSPVFTGGILSTAADQRTGRAVVGTRRESAPWPWPLPMDSLLAVFHDPASVSAAIPALGDNGAGRGEVWMLSGEGGVRQVRDAFQQHGRFARLRSLIGDEQEIAAQLETWATRGAIVILVRPPRDHLDEVAAALTQHRPRFLRRTGRWLSTWDAHPAQPAPGAVVRGG